MKRRAYHVTNEQLESLQELSRRTGLAMSEHVRRALDDYLRKMRREKKLGTSSAPVDPDTT